SLGGNTVILRLLLGGLLAACAGPVAAGEIYKCAQPDGSIAYSNVPCERGSKEVARRGYDEPVGPAASTGNQQVTPQPARTAAQFNAGYTQRSRPPVRKAQSAAEHPRKGLMEHHSRLEGQMTREQERRLTRYPEGRDN